MSGKRGSLAERFMPEFIGAADFAHTAPGAGVSRSAVVPWPGRPGGRIHPRFIL